jgi:hypothetical protein
MSQKTTEKPVIEIAPEAETESPEPQEQSFVQKTKHFVKSHKRPAIAVGALVALVGVAAVTGRKTAPEPQALELDSPDVIDVEPIEVLETENA